MFTELISLTLTGAGRAGPGCSTCQHMQRMQQVADYASQCLVPANTCESQDWELAGELKELFC